MKFKNLIKQYYIANGAHFISVGNILAATCCNTYIPNTQQTSKQHFGKNEVSMRSQDRNGQGPTTMFKHSCPKICSCTEVPRETKKRQVDKVSTKELFQSIQKQKTMLFLESTATLNKGYQTIWTQLPHGVLFACHEPKRTAARYERPEPQNQTSTVRQKRVKLKSHCPHREMIVEAHNHDSLKIMKTITSCPPHPPPDLSMCVCDVIVKHMYVCVCVSTPVSRASIALLRSYAVSPHFSRGSRQLWVAPGEGTPSCVPALFLSLKGKVRNASREPSSILNFWILAPRSTILKWRVWSQNDATKRSAIYGTWSNYWAQRSCQKWSTEFKTRCAAQMLFIVNGFYSADVQPIHNYFELPFGHGKHSHSGCALRLGQVQDLLEGHAGRQVHRPWGVAMPPDLDICRRYFWNKTMVKQAHLKHFGQGRWANK